LADDGSGNLWRFSADIRLHLADDGLHQRRHRGRRTLIKTLGNRGKEEIGVKKRIVLMLVVASLFAVSAFAQAPVPVPYQPLSGAAQTGVRWGLVSAAFVL